MARLEADAKPSKPGIFTLSADGLVGATRKFPFVVGGRVDLTLSSNSSPRFPKTGKIDYYSSSSENQSACTDKMAAVVALSSHPPKVSRRSPSPSSSPSRPQSLIDTFCPPFYNHACCKFFCQHREALTIPTRPCCC